MITFYINQIARFIPTIIFILTMVLPTALHAQRVDSLMLTLGFTTTIADRSYQPLWIAANRFALLSDDGKDVAAFAGIHHTHTFPTGTRSVRISYGANLVNNQHFRANTIQLGYLKVGYGAFEIRGGRYKETLDEIDPVLSTGSLGISANALPIPKIGLAFPDYTPIPFTKEWVSIKGVFSHGWMGKNQFIKDAFLHEKSVYLRFGKKRFKFYTGAQHFGVWGGYLGDVSIDHSFQEFLNVVLVRGENEHSRWSDIISNPAINRAGDQRGLFEFGMDVDWKDVHLHFYHQTPFESGNGVTVRNTDRLAGVNIQLKKHHWLKSLLVEFIHTKQMEEHALPPRRSYYNHGVYATGWEYEYRSMGTPLFINRYRGSNFLPVDAIDWRTNNSTNLGESNFINNRIVGGHVGMLHRYAPGITGRTMLTYTRNFGTHNNFITRSPENQVYTLHEVTAAIKRAPGLRASAGIGYDRGGFYDNVGGLLGVQYVVRLHKSQAAQQTHLP